MEEFDESESSKPQQVALRGKPQLSSNDVQLGLPGLLTFPGLSHLKTCPIKENVARFIRKPEIIGIHE